MGGAVMSPTKSEVLELVNTVSSGLTTQQVIGFLGGTDYAIRTKLSRLYAYGQIDKESAGGNRALWKRREASDV